MEDNFGIQLFEGKKVRFVWDEEQEKYFFSVTDIVEILTDTVNPRDYIKKMLRRDAELKSKWGTICPPVEMLAPDGKRRKTQAADLEGIFRIIQSIPSKKVEPVKQWLAQLGSQRIDQMIDPELTFQMANIRASLIPQQWKKANELRVKVAKWLAMLVRLSKSV